MTSKTSSSEPVLTRAETVALIGKLAESIYGAHVHGGKAFISMVYAVELAATTIGAIQSATIAGFVEEAIEDPEGCLKKLNERRMSHNKKVDSENDHKIDRLASALERERSHSQESGETQ